MRGELCVVEIVKHLTWLDWVVIVLLGLAALRALTNAARGIVKTTASVALLSIIAGAAWWLWRR